MVFCVNVYSEQVGKNAACELVHYTCKLVIVFEEIMELFPQHILNS